jgi:hypothetical protein
VGRIIPVLALAVAAVLTAAGARAQSETDRLREALRGLTAQARALEDQRAVLLAKQVESDRERERLRRENDALKKQIKESEQAYRQAVDEFNQRLEERNETLEKWKGAYAEAADVARTKDAERAKFEAEANSFKASSKACAVRNMALVKVSNEILQRYDDVTIGDILVAREPLTGIRRVEIQNMLQDYRDKVLEQKIEQAEQQQRMQPTQNKPKVEQVEQKGKP